ncbi:MAG: alpha/beta hydrolase [Planctomycetes bacterium]|nr:alpha/beta hydrolase [Planctomycetota bacterium]
MNCKYILIVSLTVMMFSGCFGPPRIITNPPMVKVHKNIVYAVDKKDKLKLDIYMPEHISKPSPALLWIHGGGWVRGSKRYSPIAPIATRGIVMVSVQYRLLSEETPWPTQLHDLKAAVRFLRKNAKEYNIDPNRIGAWGVSAGGHLASMLGVSQGIPELEGALGVTDASSEIQCVVAYCPPTNMTVLYESDVNWKMHYAIRSLLNGKPKDNPKLATAVNPATYASNDDAPHIFIHGDQDPIVPVNQSTLLSDALIEQGVEAEVHILEDQPHGNIVIKSKAGRDEVHAFLQKHLGAGAVPGPAGI